MTAWRLEPIPAGARLLVQVYPPAEFPALAGTLSLTRAQYADLRTRLDGSDPAPERRRRVERGTGPTRPIPLSEVDLHGMHPQPGQPAAEPVPAGVDGFAVSGRHNHAVSECPDLNRPAFTGAEGRPLAFGGCGDDRPHEAHLWGGDERPVQCYGTTWLRHCGWIDVHAAHGWGADEGPWYCAGNALLTDTFPNPAHREQP